MRNEFIYALRKNIRGIASFMLFILLFANSGILFAQNDSVTLERIEIPEQKKKDEELIITMVERWPEYKFGGEKGLHKLLRDSIIYPKDSILGKVYVTFLVSKDGKVSDPRIARGLSPDADKEALRLLKMLEFTPAMLNGKSVSVYYILPISFVPGEYDQRKRITQKARKSR